MSNDVEDDICVAIIHRENYDLINLFHYCEEIVIRIIVINMISAWPLFAPVVYFWNIIWWIAYFWYPLWYNLCKLLFIYTYDTDISMWIAQNKSCFVVNVPHHHSHMSHSFLCAGLNKLVLLPPNCRGFLCIHCERIQWHQTRGPFIHKLATWKMFKSQQQLLNYQLYQHWSREIFGVVVPIEVTIFFLILLSTESSLRYILILEIY